MSESGVGDPGGWIPQAGIAIAAIITAAAGLLGSRGRARADENKELRGKVARLQQDRDAAVEYVYDCRRVLHAAGVDPPPWPKKSGEPPWAVAEGQGDPP